MNRQGIKQVCIVVLIAMLFLSACQPTPDEEEVTSKNKDLVKEVVIANQEENKESLQEDKEVIEQQIMAINKHINNEIQLNDRVKIVVDAEVIAPVYDKIPLVRVAPENLTKEHLEILLHEVARDNPVYYQSVELSIWSKEEIEQVLLQLKGFLQNDSLELHIKKHLEGSISSMEEFYAISKARQEEKLYNGSLVPAENNKYYSAITHLKSYLGKTQAARIELWQSFNKTKNQLVFRNEDYGAVYNTFEPYKGVDADKIEISYEECKKIAEELVKALDGQDTNMTLFASNIGYSIGFFADYTKETSPQVYSFRFAREYNGVVVKPVNCLRRGDNVNYRQQVQTERMYIVIDNEGICTFMWTNLTKYLETVTEDVPLIDFKAVNDIFEDYCRFKFVWVPKYDNIPEDLTVTINLYRIELNLMMTSEKDNLDNYIMIPVWDFIGDVDYDEKIIGQDGYTYDGEKNISILTINAIDGTVIDREQGY